MCRAGGRRCEKKWDNSHKERYNARRRIVRNTEKAEAAAASGHTAAAVEYAHLASDAKAAAERLDHEIDQHEFASARDPRLPESTRSVAYGDLAVDDVPLERAGDRKRVVNTAADHGVDPEAAEHLAQNLDRWSGRLYHPRVVMARDRDGTVVGTLVYEDDRAQYRPEVVIKDMRATSEDRQRQGVGSTLIEHMRATARTGLQRPSGKTVPRSLEVTNVVTTAQGFYEKMGAEFTPGFSAGKFDLDPNSGRCPDCGQWANSSHQCEARQGHDDALVSLRDRLNNDEGESAADRAAVAAHAEWKADKATDDARRCRQCGQYADAAHECPAPSEQALATWRNNLTDTEREARSEYGSILAIDLNEKLRNNEGAIDSLDTDEQQIVAGMDSAIARAPRADEPYTVHRGIATRYGGKGVPGPEWVAANTTPGEVITFHGYTSTSLDQDQAEYFAGANQEDTESGVLFSIDTRQGANWGSDGPEAEVTLARNSSFEVVAVDPDHEVNGKPYPKVTLRGVAKCENCGQFASSDHTCPPTRIKETLSDGAQADVTLDRDEEAWGGTTTYPDGTTVRATNSKIIFYNPEGQIHRDMWEGPAMVTSDGRAHFLQGGQGAGVWEDEDLMVNGRAHLAGHEKYAQWVGHNPPASGPYQETGHPGEYQQDYVDGTTEIYRTAGPDDDEEFVVESAYGLNEDMFVSRFTRNGEDHREVGPAVVDETSLRWAHDGALHRNPDNGPAVVQDNGAVEYWREGKKVDPGDAALARHGVVRAEGGTMRLDRDMTSLQDDDEYGRYYRRGHTNTTVATNTGTGTSGAEQCPDCGRFAGPGHICPATTSDDQYGYRMTHRAPHNDSDSDEAYYNHIANLTESFPEDVYEHPDWYGTADEETLTQLRVARDNPDAELTIYRAVPEGVDEINRGDWITLSREYAEEHAHGLESGNKDGVVISRQVPASQVWTDGNDLGEYGYDGPTDLRNDSPAAPSPEGHPLAVAAAEPVDFAYTRRTDSSYDHVVSETEFGRDVEPAGRYMVEAAPGGFVPENSEAGTVRFEQPLHLDVGDGDYDSPDNWKRRLSAHYDGKTGRALSQAIRDDGYDAITTRDKYGTGEVVDLTGFTPSNTGATNTTNSTNGADTVGGKPTTGSRKTKDPKARRTRAATRTTAPVTHDP